MAKAISNGSVDWADRAAVVASVACMVHCLALPLIVAALPALATILTLPAAFHFWLLAFAIPTAALALLRGRSQHGAWWPTVAGAAGLALLATGALMPESAAETVVTVSGSLLLVLAHVANWRLRRACH